MNKFELLAWLQEEHRQWEALLNQVGPTHMEQAGLNGQWSFKDLIAHLTPDGLRCIANLRAIQHNEPEPPPPWPANLQTDDEINAWLYKTNHARSASQVLDESREMFRQLFAAVNALPDDVKIETMQQGEHKYYLVHLGDRHVQPGYFFDHLHDDHEQDVRTWLTPNETTR